MDVIPDLQNTSKKLRCGVKCLESQYQEGEKRVGAAHPTQRYGCDLTLTIPSEITRAVPAISIRHVFNKSRATDSRNKKDLK